MTMMTIQIIKFKKQNKIINLKPPNKIMILLIKSNLI